MFANFFSSPSLTTDITVIAVLFLLFSAYAWYAGRSRIISLILAYYPAVFFYTSFPYMDKVLILQGDALLLANKIIIFVIFLIVFDIIISRYIFSESGYGGGHAFRTMGFSLAAVIVVLVFVHSIVDIGDIYTFSPVIENLFETADRIFLWNLAPLALLCVL